MGVWGRMRPVLPADQCGFTGHAGTEPFPGQGVQRRGFAGPCHADDGDILRRAAFGQGFLHLFPGNRNDGRGQSGRKTPQRHPLRPAPHAESRFFLLSAWGDEIRSPSGLFRFSGTNLHAAFPSVQLKSRSGSVRAAAENGRPYADERGSFLYCRFKVVAHAHGQFRQRGSPLPDRTSLSSRRRRK